MTNRSLQVVAYATFALSVALGGNAQGQADAPMPSQIGTLRLRYGLSTRSGNQFDLGPGLSYTGTTPNDVGGFAEYLFHPLLGAAVHANREGFALFLELPPNTKVTTGTLWRVAVGPIGRMQLGPVQAQAMIGYQLAQLPSFGDSANPSQTVVIVPRHAVYGQAKLGMQLPFARVEVRGELPYSLAVTAPAGSTGPSTSSGFGAGASVVVPIGNNGTLQYSLVGDYQYLQDTVVVNPSGTPPALNTTQAMHRYGVALQFDLLDHVPGLRFGTIRVQAVDEAGKALPSATVALTVAGQDVSLTATSEGAFTAAEVPPGSAVAKVTAGGYFPAEGSSTVAVGREAVIKVALKKEPPKFGSVIVTLLEKAGDAPIAGVLVKVRDVEKETSATGEAQFDDLGPGPAPVEIAVAAYHPVSEVAQVIAGKTAQMPLKLTKAKAALPATITGLIRSVAGKPVAATVEIPEMKVRTKATKEGTFTVTVPGGTYTVIITAPGFITQSKTVPVKPSDQAIYNVDLHPSR